MFYYYYTQGTGESIIIFIQTNILKPCDFYTHTLYTFAYVAIVVLILTV